MKINFKKIFGFKKFRGALVGKLDEADVKLNGLSIFFLIIFNIFIFVNLSDGMSHQSRNLASSHEYTPYDCRNLFEKKDFNYNDYISLKRYSDGVIYKNSAAVSYDADFKLDKSSLYCQKIAEFVSELNENTQFQNLVTQTQQASRELQDLQSKKYQYEREYNDFRDDYEAGLGDYNNRLSDIDDTNVRNNYESILTRIDLKQKALTNKQADFARISTIKNLHSYIQSNKSAYDDDRSNYEYWYPVKVTLLQIVLILPILLVSLFIFNWAIKRRNKILSLLGSNLALISGLFALFILFKIIYWLFPHTLLENVFIYLSSIKALAIWNYVLVILGIVIFGALMYFSQKFFDKWKKMKVEQAKRQEELNKDKVIKQRFWDKTCMNCNTKLLPGAKCCGNCGYNQYDVCSKCGHEAPKCYKHCDNCGTKK